MVVSKQFDYSKTSKNTLQCRRTSQFIENLGITVQSEVSSSIKGSNETRECKSLRFSHGHWIGDGPRDFTMSRVKKKRMKLHPSDLDLTLLMHFHRF